MRKAFTIIALLIAAATSRAQAPIDSMAFMARQAELQAEAIRAINNNTREFARGVMVGGGVMAAGSLVACASQFANDPKTASNLAVAGFGCCVAGAVWMAVAGSSALSHNVTFDERGFVVSIDRKEKRKR